MRIVRSRMMAVALATGLGVGLAPAPLLAQTPVATPAEAIRAIPAEAMLFGLRESDMMGYAGLGVILMLAARQMRRRHGTKVVAS